MLLPRLLLRAGVRAHVLALMETGGLRPPLSQVCAPVARAGPSRAPCSAGRSIEGGSGARWRFVLGSGGGRRGGGWIGVGGWSRGRHDLAGTGGLREADWVLQATEKEAPAPSASPGAGRPKPRKRTPRGKRKKGRATKAGPKNYRANPGAYKDLVFKWFLQAFPESIARQEIAGRLNAHPKKVKDLLIKPLLNEGKIIRWGARTTPYERYMPNIKAPEYYEVTGEEPPKMPVVDENELINAIPSREAVPGLKKSRMAAEAEAERALAATGFQDQWREAGELEGDEAEEGGLDEIQSLQATGWDDLWEDDEEDEEDEEEGSEDLSVASASRQPFDDEDDSYDEDEEDGDLSASGIRRGLDDDEDEDDEEDDSDDIDEEVDESDDGEGGEYGDNVDDGDDEDDEDDEAVGTSSRLDDWDDESDEESDDIDEEEEEDNEGSLSRTDAVDDDSDDDGVFLDDNVGWEDVKKRVR